MRIVFEFFQNYFNVNVLMLFFISSLFLLYFDDNIYKANEMKREHRFTLVVGYGYIFISLVVFVLVKVM